MLVDFRPIPHLLQLRRLLFLLRGPIFFGKLVLVLPEIHDPANRRATVRCNLYQIEFQLPGALKRLARRNDPDLLTIDPNQPDWRYPNAIVYADVLFSY